MGNGVVIQFKNVTKTYKLFKNSKARFKAVFSNKVKYTEKTAIDNISFTIKKESLWHYSDVMVRESRLY